MGIGTEIRKKVDVLAVRPLSAFLRVIFYDERNNDEKVFKENGQKKNGTKIQLNPF